MHIVHLVDEKTMAVQAFFIFKGTKLSTKIGWNTSETERL